MESGFKKWCKENKIPVSIPNCISYQATIKIGWKAALEWVSSLNKNDWPVLQIMKELEKLNE